MTEEEIIAMIRQLSRDDLTAWCARGWVQPARQGNKVEYRAVDVARVQLICEMRDDLAVNEEGIAVVLDLMDQLYDARARLRALGEAVLDQPVDVQRQIETLVRNTLGH
jgi:chaperone modulatory protein CbpM